MRLPTFYEQNLIPNWGSYNDLLWVNGAIDLRVGVRDENKGRVESVLTDSPALEKRNNTAR